MIGFDGSHDSATAIARAGELLSCPRALVVHIWTGLSRLLLRSDLGGMPETIAEAAKEVDAADRERAEALAAKGAQLATAAGFEAQWRIRPEQSNPWRSLSLAATELDSRAVVVGARGQSRVASMLLGSVSQGLANHAPAPVLIVPAAASAPTDGPLVFAVDGSENAERAIDVGCALLAPRPAVVAHVWQSWVVRTPAYVPGVSGTVLGMAKELDEIAIEQATEIVTKGAARAERHGFACRQQSLQTERPLWRGILDVAEENEAAAIVVGCRGLTGISAALGSVSQGVVHHSERPVLLVPTSPSTGPTPHHVADS